MNFKEIFGEKLGETKLPETHTFWIDVNNLINSNLDFQMRIDQWYNTLTMQEKFLLLLALDGYTQKDITKKISLVQSTVSHHLSKLKKAVVGILKEIYQ